MKKISLFSFLTLILMIGSVHAQKFAYVNSEYILDNVPEYKNAQEQLDQLSAQWQKEIEIRYNEIDKMYKAYQAEQILLTDEMKKKREEEIVAKEKEVKEFQKQKFGYEGELFKKKQDLVRPVQDKIYNAVKKIADAGGYAVIFDKSSDLTMLYTNVKYDKSDDVIEAMGYKKGSGSEKESTGPKKKSKKDN